MTDTNNAAQPLLTDEEINAACDWPASNTTMRAENDRAMAREVEAAVLRKLSKLRAPVADERADFNAWLKTQRNPDDMNKAELVAAWEAWQERGRRAALASAPVAGEADVIWKYTHFTGRIELSLTPFSGPAFVKENWVATPYYAAPQASEAVRDAALEEAAQTAYKALFPTNDRSDWTEFAESAAYHAEYAAQCIRALKPQSAALSAQPGAQRTGGSDA